MAAEPTFFTYQSNTPPQAAEHQICNATSGGGFDSRGIRQIRAQAPVLDSLLAEINVMKLKLRMEENYEKENISFTDDSRNDGSGT